MLMNKFLAATLSVAWLAGNLPASGDSPIVEATVDGHVTEIPLVPAEKPGAMSFDSTFFVYTEEGRGFDAASTSPYFGTVQPPSSLLAAFFQIAGNLNPDPAITYSLTVTDAGAPSDFSFLLSTPIVPTGPDTSVSAFVIGELTDATGEGVALTPSGSKLQEGSVGNPLTPMGVDVGDGASYPPAGA